MANKNSAATQYLTRSQVLSRYSIGNTTLYRWIKDSSVVFPKPMRLGARTVRWSMAKLEKWEAERVN